MDGRRVPPRYRVPVTNSGVIRQGFRSRRVVKSQLINS